MSSERLPGIVIEETLLATEVKSSDPGYFFSEGSSTGCLALYVLNRRASVRPCPLAHHVSDELDLLSPLRPLSLLHLDAASRPCS